MIDATRILDLLVGGNQGGNSPFGDAPNQVPARTDNPQQQQPSRAAPPI